MVYSSAQISGLVGGQMAMFSNQQQFSQQISGLYGTGPGMAGGGMSNPFPTSAGPGFGAGMAQGMAGSIEGVMGGAALAGGFMGGAAGWADPFTAMMRVGGSNMGALRGLGGAIQAGYGFGSTGGVALPGASANIGRGLMGAASEGFGFMRGVGARGALSGLAGGLGAAAATGGLYYAATLPIMEGAEQFAAGAQNVADVGMMAQAHMGPQFGQAGARPGGGMGRGQIREMVGVLEEIASQDTMASMDSLKRLMDQAGQSGLLQGIGSAQEFKQKFGKMVQQVKQVAQVMGTSLEEAAPLFGQMSQMGLWRTSDIMGTAGAMRAVGPAAAPQMMAAMQSGAQLSHAMGGRLGAGAAMGRDAFLGVQSAVRTGVLSPEQVMEFTGGVGGVEGQRMVAQQMQGVMGRFSETSMGRLMMAGLGRFEGGKFTGGVDKKMMDRFMRGEIDVGELQRIGQQRTSSSREAATSYMVRKGTIGQEMMASGGMEGLSQAVTQVMERAGYGGAGENIQNMFIQKMTGVDARTAEMLRNIGNDIGRIQEDKQRRLEAALDDSFREVDIRMNHSWQGFKDSMGQAFDESFRPMRELGADVATAIGQKTDRAIDYITGRTKKYGMTSRQLQQRLWSEGGLTDTGGLELSARGQAGMSASTSTSERIRNMSRTDRGFFGLGGLASAAFGLEAGTQGEQLARMGAETVELGYGQAVPEGFTRIDEGQSGLSAIALGPLGAIAGAVADISGAGGGRAVRVSDRDEIIRGAVTRSEDRTWSGMGFAGKKEQIQKDLDKAKGAMRRLLASDPALAKEFAEYKEDNPEVQKQTDWLMKKLEKKDPQAAQALKNIAAKSGKGSKNERMKDAMALVIEDAGIKGPWRPDYEKEAGVATEMEMFSSTEEFDQAIADTIEVAAEQGAAFSFTQVVGREGLAGAYARTFDMLTGAGPTEEFRDTLERVTQSGWAGTFARALEGDKAAIDEIASGSEEMQAAWAKLGDVPKGQKEKFVKSLKTIEKRRGGRAALQVREKTAQLAKRALQEGAGEGLEGPQKEAFQKLLKTYAEGGAGTKAAERLTAQLMETDLRALAEEGGVVGQQVARYGQARKAIGGFRTGAGVTTEQLEKELGQFRLPEEMRKELKKLVESGGEFTEEEKASFQKMFTQRAGQAGVMGGQVGRGASTQSLTDSLTRYTDANTKFVFAVGAAISGIEKKDLEQTAKDLENTLQEKTGKRPGVE